MARPAQRDGGGPPTPTRARRLEKSRSHWRRHSSSAAGAGGSSRWVEALERVCYFKHHVEKQDLHKLINKGGEPFFNEKDVQL